MHPLESRLRDRAASAGLFIADALQGPLLAYYDLLLRWNAKINLTALDNADEAIDRLLLEPIAAARHLGQKRTLMDLGSGGGSPAIPLALALQSPKLVMVESKGRKAAFLREAATVTGVAAVVEAERFEVLAERRSYVRTFDVVSMRAVRMDLDALGVAVKFAAPDGRVALFVSPASRVKLPVGAVDDGRVKLLPSADLQLFHVERLSV